MTQYALPTSDITIGSWSTSPLYSKINDSSDATYITGPSGATTACEVGLGSVTDPVSSASHIVTVRAKVNSGSGAAEKLTFYLYEGATLIASSGATNISRTTITDYPYTLAAAEADAITNYADLRIRIAQTTISTGEAINIYDASLAIPDAPATTVGIFGQAQTAIRAFNNVSAQAQTCIRTTYNGSGQAGTHVGATYYGFAQSLTRIQRIGQGFGQVQVQIYRPISIPNGYAQGLALIGRTTDLYTYIDETTVDTSDVIYSGIDGADYYETKLSGSGTPDYLQDIVIHTGGFTTTGTANVTVGLYQGATLRASTIIALTTTPNIFSYALTNVEIASITAYNDLRLRFISSSVPAGGRVIISWARLQTPPSSGVVRSNKFGQAQVSVKGIGTQPGQVCAVIKTNYTTYSQVLALIKIQTLKFSQAHAQIKNNYRYYAQAQSLIKQSSGVFAQTKAHIRGTSGGYAQAAARIKGQPNAYGQTQAFIFATVYRYSASAQAQAKLNSTSSVFGQALTIITQLFSKSAQATGWIKSIMAIGAQAGAHIFATSAGTAQAQASIGYAYYQNYAQAQTRIICTFTAQGQAKAYIQVFVKFSQAQARIKGRNTKSGQAVAYIAGTFTYAQDTFTRTTSNSWGTADVGGTWSLGEFNGIGLDTTGTEAIISHDGVEDFITLQKIDAKNAVEAYIKFKINRLPTYPNYIALGLALYLPSMSYEMQWNAPPEPTFVLYIQSDGTYAHHAGYYVSTLSEATIGTNEYWWYKIRVEMTKTGSMFYAKAWQDADGEPAGWQVSSKSLDLVSPGGHVGIWSHFDATTTMTLDNYNVYNVKSVHFAQAQVYIIDQSHRAYGQAGVAVTKTVKYGQALGLIRESRRAYGQSVARIQNGYLNYPSYAQAKATIAGITTSTGQANAFIYGQWFQYSQARAKIGCVTVYAQAQGHIFVQVRCYGQARSKIRINIRRYSNVQACIIGYPNNFAQSGAYVVYTGQAFAQVLAQIAPRIAHAQAQALINIHLKLAQARVHIKSRYNFAFAQAGTELGAGASRTFWVRYNGYYLPGYAQSESNISSVRIIAPDMGYKDGSLSEYNGLENKIRAFSFKVTGDTQDALKAQIQKAGTILRTGRSKLTKIYINRYDRYYLGYPHLVKLDAAATQVRLAEYQVEFMVKPWAISEATYLASGNTLIDTGARDFITTGGWTPATLVVAGNDITVSGYTEGGDFTGFVSISGAVYKPLIINTETYTATVENVNKNNIMRNLDYQLYIGPDRTYFAIEGATEATIYWQNRWYK